MSPTIIAVAGTLFLFALMFLGMPIAFSMLIAGFLGLVVVIDLRAAYSLITSDIWSQFSSYTTSVLFMFLLMGQIAYRTGVTGRLFDSAYKWIGHLRGGMALTTIVSSALFSAICGSIVATTATMASVALPEMKKYKYDDALSTGSLAAGSTLGILIPPSLAILLLALLTAQSVRTLFMAILLPGIALTLLFLLTIIVVCQIYPSIGPPGPKTTLKEKMASLIGLAETVILFSLVMGGLFLGWFTPTEAGAIGSAGIIVITCIQRKLSWNLFSLAVFDTLKTSAMAILYLTGAIVFGRFLTVTRLPVALAEFAASQAIEPYLIMIIIILIYLIGGALLDEVAFLLITLPLFFPLALALGYSPIWFTVLLVLLTTVGSITPPVGVVIFLIKGFAPDVSIGSIFKGVSIFVIPYLIFIIFMMLVPDAVLFLPNLLR